MDDEEKLTVNTGCQITIKVHHHLHKMYRDCNFMKQINYLDIEILNSNHNMLILLFYIAYAIIFSEENMNKSS